MDANLATPLAAFIAGLATSLHCAGMCGPLACAFQAPPLRYHASRFIAYGVAGSIFGAFGSTLVGVLHSPALQLAPLGMALVLIALAFGLEKRVPRPQWLTRLFVQARLRRNLGFLTPLLPCGPLWLMFGVAAVSASPIRGAILLGAFVAGTIPLYAILQSSIVHGQRRLSPIWMNRTQRAVALLAAVLLIWRTIPGDGSCH